MIDRGEPVGDHRQRVRERDEIDLTFGRNISRGVVMNGSDVGPIMELDPLGSFVEKRLAEVDLIDFLEFRQRVFEVLCVFASPCSEIDPGISLVDRQRREHLATAVKKLLTVRIVPGGLAFVEVLKTFLVRVPFDPIEGDVPEGFDGVMLLSRRVCHERSSFVVRNSREENSPQRHGDYRGKTALQSLLSLRPPCLCGEIVLFSVAERAVLIVAEKVGRDPPYVTT